MTDFERLDEAITYAAEHPNEFDMNSWFNVKPCGTTACLAGTAAMLAGWKPALDGSDYFPGEWDSVVKPGMTEPQQAEDVAMSIFDFTEVQSSIFYLPDLWSVIQRRNEWAVKEGHPERQWDGVEATEESVLL